MALIEATRDLPDKFHGIKYKALGKTGFTVSDCGFGSYRIDIQNKNHAEALKYALMNGINLIDTSSNYGDGGSEELIGNVLEELSQKRKSILDEVVIVSKGGYLQGKNLETAKSKEQEGKPYSEVVKCSPDLWHCIHPDFLKDQISQSLKKLKVKTIDIYLLHNPEYFLSYSSIADEMEKQAEYYRRIKEAFKFLEHEVEKGRISFYGISSNTFGEKSDKNNFTSLEKVLDAAKEIREANNFAVVQFPMNLMQKGGFTNLNQDNGSENFLTKASKNELGVLVNRPLNAVINNKLIRLADYEIKEDRTEKEVQKLIDDLKNLEEKIKIDYLANEKIDPSERRSLVDCFSLGEILQNNFNKFDGPNHLTEIKGYYFVPRANYAVNRLAEIYEQKDDLISGLRNYAVHINILLDSIESLLSKKHNKENEKIHNKLNRILKKDQEKLSLSQKGILFINSLHEVSCTLVGMRSKKYVDDVLKSLSQEYIEKADIFWKQKS